MRERYYFLFLMTSGTFLAFWTNRLDKIKERERERERERLIRVVSFIRAVDQLGSFPII